MTSREIAELLNKRATVELNGMTVNVKILDGREAYGRTDVLITPISGSGQTWVSAERVKVTGVKT